MLSSDVSGRLYSAVSVLARSTRDRSNTRTDLREKGLTAGATGAEKLGELLEYA